MSPTNDTKFQQSLSTLDSTQFAKPPEEDEIDLRTYWMMFSKYKGRILSLTVLIGVLTTLFTFQLQPIYRSSAKLLLETDKSKVISIEELYSTGQVNDEFYQTQVGILKSRPLAVKLVDELKLATHPAFDPVVQRQNQKFSINWRDWLPSAWLPPPAPPTADQHYQTVIGTVMKDLSITHIRNSQLVEINFESIDSELAAVVPNKLADIYIDSDLEAHLQKTKVAAGWLMGRVDELREKLATSEKALQAYLDAQQLVDVAGVKTVATSQIEQISTDLMTARRRLTEAENVYRQVQSAKDNPDAVGSLSAILNHPLVQQFRQIEAEAQRKMAEVSKELTQVKKTRDSDAFTTMPAVLENPLVQRLKEAELIAEGKVSELKQRYGEKHPQMVIALSEWQVAKSNSDQQIQKVIAAAEMELKTAKINTARQIRQVIESITKEYEVARANMEALQRAMSEKEVHIQDINRKEYQLGVLQREVDVNKQLYDLFLTRFNETDASKGLQTLQSTIGRVIDPALVATSPFKPKKQMIIGISLVLGFMFAVMLAFLIEYLDNTIKNGDDVEQKLGMPLLGTLPDLKIKKGDKEVKPRVMFLEHERSQFAESIRTIRTGIMLSNLNAKNKVLVITSSTMGEGKTTFAVNQAFALGQMGPTLLIDADMRRPAIAKTFGLTNKKPGLSELVAGTKSIDECIISDYADTKIHLLPGGAIPPNPLELLSSPQFSDLLEDLMKRYTYIVIDSPPMQAVSDAMVLSTHASAIVYVVRADSTPYKLVQESIKQLRQTNAHLLGIVLNKVDTKRLSNYYNYKYGYSKGYHSGYHQAYYSHPN